MRTVVTAARLSSKTTQIDHPVVEIEDGRILSIASRASSSGAHRRPCVRLPGATLAPAFFDVHIHGSAGHDVMEATPEALATIGRLSRLARHGSFLATTVTAPLDDTLRALEGLAKLIEQPPAPGHARILGIHLEGPFLSHAKRGVQPAAHLLAPDIATFDRLFDAAHGHARLMTLAPELPGAAEARRPRHGSRCAHLRRPLQCHSR